jgi:hypothetical protein
MGNAREWKTGTISYYAAALNAKGQIGQLFVTRENGKQVSEVWTGVIYKSTREMVADLERLNNCGA